MRPVANLLHRSCLAQAIPKRIRLCPRAAPFQQAQFAAARQGAPKRVRAGGVARPAAEQLAVAERGRAVGQEGLHAFPFYPSGSER